MNYAYDGGLTDQTTFPITNYNGNDPVSVPAIPTNSDTGPSANWVGQISQGVTISGTTVPAGSVEVALSGLPTGQTIQSIVMGNSTDSNWVYNPTNASISNISSQEFALDYFASSGYPTQGDLYFAPNRNEASSTLSLWITFSGGTIACTTFGGGSSNPAAYNPAAALPAQPVTVSSASGLLSALGTDPWIQLAAGTYSLSSQLVISEPVTITTAAGATAILQFSDSSPWTNAIEIESSHVHLSGFQVDFSSSYQYQSSNGTQNVNDPAAAIHVVGEGNTPIVDVQVDDLTITPPAPIGGENAFAFVDIMADSPTSGNIDDNVLTGNAVFVSGGPWEIGSNTLKGALAGTVLSQLVTAWSDIHDLVVDNNNVSQSAATGESDRFIYEKAGTYATIEGNYVYGGIGQPAGVNRNLPEVIMNDDTDPYYVGTPVAISGDGRILEIGTLRTGDTPLPGFVVSIISSNYTGSQRWFRIAQVINATTFLMQDPLPTSGNYTISVNYGYVDNSYIGNTLDFAYSTVNQADTGLVLGGGQFGTIVENNVFLGGTAFSIGGSITQPPPGAGGNYPAPDLWSRIPSYGVIVEGNLLENTIAGGLSAGGDPRFVDSSDRLFFQGVLSGNTVLYSSTTFLNNYTTIVPAFSVGDPVMVDAAEYNLTIPTSPGTTQNTIENDVQFLVSSSLTAEIVYDDADKGSPSSITLVAAPSPPTNPVATPDASAIQIDLSWSSVAGAQGYLVERSPNGLVGWTTIGTDSGSSTSYFDSSVSASTTYYYRIIVLTDNGYSAYSSTVSATAPSSSSPPASTLTAVSLNQNGGDLVHASENTGADGYQDEDIRLSGLNTSLSVTQVTLTAPGIASQYNAPFGSNNTNGDWRMELDRYGLSATADVYVDLGGAVSPTTEFTVNVVYSNGTSAQATLYGISVSNPDLPMPALTAVALNQDGGDLVKASENTGADGYQDEDIQLDGLNTALDVTQVTLTAPGIASQYNAPFGSNNTNGDWRMELDRYGRSATADVYVDLGGAVSPTTEFTVNVVYSNGTSAQATLYGISVSNPDLPMPALTAVSLNQDGVDLVGTTEDSGPDGYQDEDIQLDGLNTALDVTQVTLTAPGIASQYNAPLGSDNSNGDWRMELIRQGRSSTADVYVELGGVVSPTTEFTVNVVYSNGTSVTTSLYGINVTNPFLPDSSTPSSLTAVSLNQDGGDLVHASENTGADGYQDEDILLNGLNTSLSVTQVTLTAPGIASQYNAPFGSNNTNGDWRMELDRYGLSATADVYVDLGGAVSPTTEFTVNVVYSNGTSVQTTLYGISVSNPNLAMPALTAVSLNQDGVDLVGTTEDSGPDGYQDVDIQLNGLNTALAVTQVTLTASGIATSQYNAPFGSNNTNGDQRMELVRQGLSSAADVYVEFVGSVSPTTEFTITVVYSNGTSVQTTLYGISVSNPELPDAMILGSVTKPPAITIGSIKPPAATVGSITKPPVTTTSHASSSLVLADRALFEFAEDSEDEPSDGISPLADSPSNTPGPDRSAGLSPYVRVQGDAASRGDHLIRSDGLFLGLGTRYSHVRDKLVKSGSKPTWSPLA